MTENEKTISENININETDSIKESIINSNKEEDLLQKEEEVKEKVLEEKEILPDSKEEISKSKIFTPTSPSTFNIDIEKDIDKPLAPAPSRSFFDRINSSTIENLTQKRLKAIIPSIPTSEKPLRLRKNELSPSEKHPLDNFNEERYATKAEAYLSGYIAGSQAARRGKL